MSGATPASYDTPAPTQPRRLAPWAVVMLIFGTMFGVAGAGLIVGGTALAIAGGAQGADGYFTTPPATFAADSYALTSPPFDIAGDFGAPAGIPLELATLRLQARSTAPGGEVFIGVAPEDVVDRYLSSVHHSELRDVRYSPFSARYRDVPGTRAPTAPGTLPGWTVSASGPGTQRIDWTPEPGRWSVVVMNADASPGVFVALSAGIHTDLLWPIAIGVLVSGLILFVVGVVLTIAGAIGLGGQEVSPRGGPGGAPGAGPGAAGRPFPARLTGELDPALSRGLWLVKWLLALPHYIVLFFLWFAFLVATIVAGFAILFTGRYPESLFHFNVGVLRWTWRVSFYAYSALGTDQYPPFTLSRTAYPADFDVDYPERLSHGLVLVKSWLLALPHLLIVAVFIGGMWSWWTWWDGWRNTGIPLLGLLVLIAGIILLFTGRYQRGLFDLIMGINRWLYRVIAYTALMRDDYPPFRLDQGPSEPPA